MPVQVVVWVYRCWVRSNWGVLTMSISLTGSGMLSVVLASTYILLCCWVLGALLGLGWLHVSSPIRGLNR